MIDVITTKMSPSMAFLAYTLTLYSPLFEKVIRFSFYKFEDMAVASLLNIPTFP